MEVIAESLSYMSLALIIQYLFLRDRGTELKTKVPRSQRNGKHNEIKKFNINQLLSIGCL